MSREAVLGAMRRSLGVTGGEEARRDAVETRLAQAPRGLIPERGRRDAAGRLALMRDMLHAVSATSALTAREDAPGAIADYLRGHNLPGEIRHGDDPRLAALPWDKAPSLALTRGRAHGSEPVGLSHAFAGIAETGTLALLSGPDNPTSLGFLPETHIVLLDADDIVGDYESVWDRLRAARGKGDMPRTVNFVTGPSRSADIEQTLLLGAHGPRRLHVVIVEADAAGTR